MHAFSKLLKRSVFKDRLYSVCYVLVRAVDDLENKSLANIQTRSLMYNTFLVYRAVSNFKVQ